MTPQLYCFLVSPAQLSKLQRVACSRGVSEDLVLSLALQRFLSKKKNLVSTNQTTLKGVLV